MSSNNSSAASAAAASEADPLDFLDTPEMKELLAKKAEQFPTGADAIDNYLESMPLMTTRMPRSSDDRSADLAAIEALVGEELVEDRVEAFKQSGNEAYKLAVKMREESDMLELKMQAEPIDDAKARDAAVDKVARMRSAYSRRLRDAFNYYTQAIDLNTYLPLLASSVYSNRALVDILLENYGTAQADAVHAITKDRNNSKAYYRGALASYKVDKLEQAVLLIEQGQKCRHLPDSERTAFTKLLAQVNERTAQLAEREARKVKVVEEKTQKESKLRQIIDAALKQRGLRLGHSLFEQASDERYQITTQLLNDESLAFPLLFLYPEHGQSDHIGQHHELAPLQPILDQMFPPLGERPPWDTASEYTSNNLDLFITTQTAANDTLIAQSNGRASVNSDDGTVCVRVDPQQSLLAILTDPLLRRVHYAIPGVPTFIARPRQ